jgi:hypothetical protein
MVLPGDLRSAETAAHGAADAALADDPRGRWSVEFRFEGLKILPLALRWMAAGPERGEGTTLLLPDAGAAALARRDAPELAERISTLREERERQSGGSATGRPLLALGPDASDYELLEAICGDHPGPMLMLNGRLEDAAVGIGSVARARRKGFLSTWKVAYALIPLQGGALQRIYPGDWQICRQDPDGYRMVATAEERPDPEAIAAALDPDAGASLGAGLKAVDRFLGALRN